MKRNKLPKKLPKCPKCNSKDIIFYETIIHVGEYEYFDGEQTIFIFDPSSIIGVYWKCLDCRHSWKIKNWSLSNSDLGKFVHEERKRLNLD